MRQEGIPCVQLRRPVYKNDRFIRSAMPGMRRDLSLRTRCLHGSG